MKNYWGSLLLFVFLSFIFSETPAYACDCVPPVSPKEAFAESKAVFAGKVVQIYETKIEEPGLGKWPKRAVVLAVERTWKGVDETHVVVYTGFSNADCGYPFEVGEKYLVYAYGESDLFTNICSLIKPLAEAKHDVNELGKGKVPTKNVEVHKLEEHRLISYTVAAIVLAGVLYGVQRWRKKR
ncbi:hypothetical protein [Anoxybacteroides tepidamans]|uniref:hypothetical protein n=1 Tax=Anoxybacteroides tepidamans TaxID=265948 RepID=UPI000685B72A|nr:hypothetical protein [Anoxybacillus tepidamans]